MLLLYSHYMMTNVSTMYTYKQNTILIKYEINHIEEKRCKYYIEIKFVNFDPSPPILRLFVWIVVWVNNCFYFWTLNTKLISQTNKKHQLDYNNIKDKYINKLNINWDFNVDLMSRTFPDG